MAWGAEVLVAQVSSGSTRLGVPEETGTGSVSPTRVGRVPPGCPPPRGCVKVRVASFRWTSSPDRSRSEGLWVGCGGWWSRTTQVAHGVGGLMGHTPKLQEHRGV